MTVIASGTSGTIGRHLQPNVISLNQRLESLDENSLNILENDTYLHLGGMVGTQLVHENLELSKKVNIEAVSKLGEHCLKVNVSKFVFISTSHVYANSLSNKTENAPIDPLNIYAEQKFLAEEELRRIYKGQEKKLLILRLFSILDWGTKSFTLGGALAKMLNNPDHILQFGSDERDFLTPAQAAKAISEVSGLPQAFGTLNVCTGEALTISKAAKIMLERRSTKDWSKQIELTNSRVPRLVGDPSKLNLQINRKLRWIYLEDEESDETEKFTD